MGGIVAFLLIAAVVVVAAGAVGAYALASRSKKDFADANQVIPGRPTRAPASWAGSHDPEAVLHRRLRDAMAALRANQRFDDDGALLDVRVELEAQALVLDDELVSVAALPQAHRHDPLARVTEAVDAIEAAVAELASRSAVESVPRLQEALRRIRERSDTMDAIRAELDRLPEQEPQPQPESASEPAGGAEATGSGEPPQTGQPGQPGQSGQPGAAGPDPQPGQQERGGTA